MVFAGGGDRCIFRCWCSFYGRCVLIKLCQQCEVYRLVFGEAAFPGRFLAEGDCSFVFLALPFMQIRLWMTLS